MFARFIPMVGMLLLVAVAFVWRGWIQYRRYGNTGIAVFNSTDRRRQLRDGLFATLFVAIVLQTVVFAVAPQAVSGMLIVTTPPAALWIGAVLIAGGLGFTVAAQLGMGESWRIGIDDAASPGLVTGGLYQICRNPIYLGMLVCLLGLTILLPTWLSLALAVGVVWCIRTQTIEEEAYLEQTYGADFRRYAARVGRFLPWLGKLSPSVPPTAARTG